MGEWFDTLKSHLNDRMGNPWVGAYSLSWLVVNYSIVIVVFSTMPPIEKISYIQAGLYGSALAVAHSFAIPLLMAFLYIFALPHPARWALEYTLEQNKRIKSIRQKIEEETLLSEADAKKIRAAAREEVRSVEEELKDVRNKYGHYKETSERLERDLQIINAKLDEKENDLELYRQREKSLSQQVEILMPVSKAMTMVQNALARREIELRAVADEVYKVIGPSKSNDVEPSMEKVFEKFVNDVLSGRYTYEYMVANPLDPEFGVKASDL